MKEALRVQESAKVVFSDRLNGFFSRCSPTWMSLFSHVSVRVTLFVFRSRLIIILGTTYFEKPRPSPALLFPLAHVNLNLLTFLTDLHPPFHLPSVFCYQPAAKDAFLDMIVNYLSDVAGGVGTVVPWHNIQRDLFPRKVQCSHSVIQSGSTCTEPHIALP